MRDMVILIDTNVIIDFLITREPYFASASEIITKCAGRELQGYIAFHTVSNLWYVLRKVPVEKRRKWLVDICEFLQVTGVGHDEVLKAIKMTTFGDFEDCLQDRCAESIGAAFIITRNVDDFTNSAVPAILPEDFLTLIKQSQ